MEEDQWALMGFYSRKKTQAARGHLRRETAADVMVMKCDVPI